MPWNQVKMADQRLEFVIRTHQGSETMSELCRQYGISRQTGYVWRRRYEAEGAVGVLVEHSRRPLGSPRRVASEQEEKIVALRQQYPDWGPKKLRVLLEKQLGESKPPSLSTIHRVLDRRQLIQPEDRHRPARKRFEREKPNQLWQMDFKGPLGFNRGMGPLSVQDDHSRYVVLLKDTGSTQAAVVKEALQGRFEECGVPEAMLMDHGTPWWNAQSPWGWTTLTVWLMRQGIRVYFSGYRHPQTQGKVERMHGCIQSAWQHRGQPAWEQGWEQSWLDAFRQEYNQVRPHEALGMATPATRWVPSARPYQPQPPEWQYPGSHQVVRLGSAGQLYWQRSRWEISAALRGQTVGIQPVGERAVVYFCCTPLRELDLKSKTSRVLPTDPVEEVSAVMGGEGDSNAVPFPCTPSPLGRSPDCQGCPDTDVSTMS